MLREIITTEQIKDLICKIVDEKLEPFGQFACNLYEGEDNRGDESLFVEVCYAGDAIPVPAKISIELRSNLRDELLKVGETRFAYLRYLIDYPE